MAEPAEVDCPGSLWRVGRASQPVHFSRIDPVDAAVATAGNRFDVPGGDVMYAATDPSGSYAETLARLRPSARMRALSQAGDEGFMSVGSVPAEWRMNRALVAIHPVQPAPFLDVEATETHTYLTEVMAPVLTSLGIEHLDVARVRGANRLVTRAIALHAYVAMDEDGELLYSGIRYMSKVGDFECWAIFGGTEVAEGRRLTVEKNDPHLARVAQQFDLTIH